MGVTRKNEHAIGYRLNHHKYQGKIVVIIIQYAIICLHCIQIALIVNLKNRQSWPNLYVCVFHSVEGKCNSKVICIIILSDDLNHQYLLTDIAAMVKSADEFFI